MLDRSTGDTEAVADYLIRRLHNYGIRHVFGVPGDYVLSFFDKLVNTKGIHVINTCDEQGAAFAADAYARVKGLGVVCVTYSVGGFKVLNAIAQAFAEKSPLVVVSGAPGMNERHKNPLLHHKVQDFDTQQRIFEHLTIDSALLSNPDTAMADIDRVLSSAVLYKRPVYLELPRDIVSLQLARTYGYDFPSTPHFHIPDPLRHERLTETDQEALKEALNETLCMINSSSKPVIIAGIEIHRFGLQDKLLQLIEKTKIPVVSTLLSKSVVDEQDPNYLGVYAGNMSRKSVQRYVESSDCVIMIGVFLTHVNFGITHTPVDHSRSIYLSSDGISIRYHNYEDVRFDDFLDELVKADLKSFPFPPLLSAAIKGNSITSPLDHDIKKKTMKITSDRLFEILDAALSGHNIVIADVGDSMFGSIDLTIPNPSRYLSSSYYLSMGFAVPASIGAQLANPLLRPIVIVGDGAFQMTGMEVSTMAMFNLNPIIIVLNNSGYRTERAILDGAFNDIKMWNYSKIPDVVGSGRGFLIDTEEEFIDALSKAEQATKDFCLLDVRLNATDASSALHRLGESIGKKV
jgi:TPP-dependent 2-oxoacid decarboxylase